MAVLLLFCALLSLGVAIECVVEPGNGEYWYGTCLHACKGSKTESASATFKNTQITANEWKCMISVTGHCDMPFAWNVQVKPANAFEYKVELNTKCPEAYEDGWTQDPKSSLDAPLIPPLVTTIFSGIGIGAVVLVLVFFCCAHCCDCKKGCSLVITIFVIFALLALVGAIVVGGLYLSDCAKHAVDPDTYTFGIYTGKNLSVNDDFKPTDPKIKSCDVRTDFDLWFKQTCTCYYFDGETPSVKYRWEGTNRYENCQDFVQPTGCDEDSWEYTLRIAGFSIACIIIFLPCACLILLACGSSRGGGTATVGYTRVRKFVLVEVD